MNGCLLFKCEGFDFNVPRNIAKGLSGVVDPFLISLVGSRQRPSEEDAGVRVSVEYGTVVLGSSCLLERHGMNEQQEQFVALGAWRGAETAEEELRKRPLKMMRIVVLSRHQRVYVFLHNSLGI